MEYVRSLFGQKPTPSAAFRNNPANRNESQRRVASLYNSNSNRREREKVKALQASIMKHRPNLVEQAQAELNAQEQNGLTPIPPTPQPAAPSNRALAAAQVPLPRNQNNIVAAQRKAAREQPNIWNMNQDRTLFQLGPERVVKSPVLSPSVLSPPVLSPPVSSSAVQPVSFVQSASRRNRRRHNTTPGLARAQLRKQEKLKARFLREEAAAALGPIPSSPLKLPKLPGSPNLGLGAPGFPGVASLSQSTPPPLPPRRSYSPNESAAYARNLSAAAAARAAASIPAAAPPAISEFSNLSRETNLTESQPRPRKKFVVPNQNNMSALNSALSAVGGPAPPAPPEPLSPSPPENYGMLAQKNLSDLEQELFYIRTTLSYAPLQPEKKQEFNDILQKQRKKFESAKEDFPVNDETSYNILASELANIRENLLPIHREITGINSPYRISNKRAAAKAAAEQKNAEKARAALSASRSLPLLPTSSVSGAVAAAQAPLIAEYAARNAAAAAAKAAAAANAQRKLSNYDGIVDRCNPCEKIIIEKLDLLLTPSASSQALTTMMKSVTAATKTAYLAFQSAERKVALSGAAMGGAGQEVVRQSLNFAIDKYNAAIDAITYLPPFPNKDEVLAKLVAGRNAAVEALGSVGFVIGAGIAAPFYGAYEAAQAAYNFVANFKLPPLPTLEGLKGLSLKASWAAQKTKIETALGLKPDWYTGPSGLKARIGSRYQAFRQSLKLKRVKRNGQGNPVLNAKGKPVMENNTLKNRFSRYGASAAKTLRNARTSIAQTMYRLSGREQADMIRDLVERVKRVETIGGNTKKAVDDLKAAMAAANPGVVTADIAAEAAAAAGPCFQNVNLSGKPVSGAAASALGVEGGGKRSRKNRKGSRKH